MFGRNVQPPVHSCNSTGSSPKSCLRRRGGSDGGGDKGGNGGEIRWMWRGGDEHKTRQAIGGHFFPDRSNSAQPLTRARRYVDTAALLGVLHFSLFFCLFFPLLSVIS